MGLYRTLQIISYVQNVKAKGNNPIYVDDILIAVKSKTQKKNKVQKLLSIHFQINCLAEIHHYYCFDVKRNKINFLHS